MREIIWKVVTALGLAATITSFLYQLVKSVAGLPAWLSEPTSISVAFGLIFIFLVMILFSTSLASLRQKVKAATVFMAQNISLLLFGNITNRKLAEATLRALQYVPFGRLFDLKDPGDGSYFIVYTHKDHPESEVDVGDDGHYRIPGFPFDEAETIIRIWSLVANYLNLDWRKVKIYCSCCFDREPYRNEVCSSSFTIVGSSKGNVYCRSLMSLIDQLDTVFWERTRRYVMKTSGNSCLVDEPNKKVTCIPSPTDPRPGEKEVLTDYAIIMKIPNVFSFSSFHAGEYVIDEDKLEDPACLREARNNTIVLLAGCKVAGQVALIDWVSRPDSLTRLAEEYYEKYFQTLLEVKYNFRPRRTPRIISIEKLFEEEFHIKKRLDL